MRQSKINVRGLSNGRRLVPDAADVGLSRDSHRHYFEAVLGGGGHVKETLNLAVTADEINKILSPVILCTS